MLDDYAVASTATLAVLQKEIKAFVPAMFQSKIPPDDLKKVSDEIAKAVVDALKENQVHRDN